MLILLIGISLEKEIPRDFGIKGERLCFLVGGLGVPIKVNFEKISSAAFSALAAAFILVIRGLCYFYLILKV